jgi:hypothetical protein
MAPTAVNRNATPDGEVAVTHPDAIAYARAIVTADPDGHAAVVLRGFGAEDFRAVRVDTHYVEFYRPCFVVERRELVETDLLMPWATEGRQVVGIAHYERLAPMP